MYHSALEVVNATSYERPPSGGHWLSVLSTLSRSEIISLFQVLSIDH